MGNLPLFFNWSPPMTSLRMLVMASILPSAVWAQRPMTFLDVQQTKTISGAAVSPDRTRLLYTISVPDWKEAKRQTDIYMVSLAQGVGSTRQLTFSRDKSENNPRWTPDGASVVFSSNRDSSAATPWNQLYVIRTDGGEARRITDAKGGVADFAFTRDGKWLVYGAGKPEDRQLWALPAAGLDSAQPKQLTRHSTPVRSWSLTRDGSRIYFIAPDTVDKDNAARREKKFTVNIRNEEQPVEHLWALDLGTLEEKRLTSGSEYTVSNVSMSRDGKWVGFRGTPNDRYKRNVTETSIYGDAYLLETATGHIERLTTNAELGESPVEFSPDGAMIAISAPNDWTYFRDNKIWVRPTATPGAAWRKLGGGYDSDLNVGWWSDDGKTIYCLDGIKSTNQVVAVSVENGEVRRITDAKGTLFVEQDDATGTLILVYGDPATPNEYFTVASAADLANQGAWRRLTNANPQTAQLALGAAEEVSWKSKDGKTVGGVLVKPVGYQQGRRYPLIVQIHGGPAAADQLLLESIVPGSRVVECR